MACRRHRLRAAAYLTIDYGRPPWISLAVALTFAFYGLTKKQLGATLDATHSLAAETTVLLPVALVIVIVLDAQDATTFSDTAPRTPCSFFPPAC